MRKAMLIVLLLLGVGLLQAQVTAAGDTIKNWSTVTYKGTSGSSSWTEWSDTTMIIMDFSASVEIQPDSLTKESFLECQVEYAHTIWNRGNGEDSLVVTAVSSHGWVPTLYWDSDGDGSSSGEAPLGRRTLDIGDSLNIVVSMTIGDHDSLWGDIDELIVVVASATDPTATDTSRDFTTIVGPDLSLNMTADPASPGYVAANDTIEYGLAAVNSDTDSTESAWNAYFKSARPSGTSFIDSITAPTGYTVEYLMGGVWGAFDALADSIQFVLGGTDSIARADSVYFTWLVKADSCLVDSVFSVSARAMYEDSSSCGHVYYDSSNTVTTDVNSAGVSIVDTLVEREGNVGDRLFFPYTITNTGDNADNFVFDLDTLVEGSTWPNWEVYEDGDGSGTLGPGELGAGAITETGILAPGADFDVVVTVVVPDTSLINDTTMIVVNSTEDFCVSDTAWAFAHMTMPQLLIQMNILEDETDPDIAYDDEWISYPDSFVTYKVKMWNIGDGDADSFFVVDSLDSFTVLQGDAKATVIATIPAGLALTDIDVEVYDGGSWVAMPTTGEVTRPAGLPTIIRFSETGPGTLQPVLTPPADPETEAGQLEFLYRIRLN